MTCPSCNQPFHHITYTAGDIKIHLVWCGGANGCLAVANTGDCSLVSREEAEDRLVERVVERMCRESEAAQL